MDENIQSQIMGDSMLSQGDTPVIREEQSRAEKIELRRCYRKLIQETQENKEELIKPESNGIMVNIAKAQEYFERVKETREGALDSRFMSLAVSLGAQKTSLLQTDLVAFQPDEFVQKLITFMGGTIGEDVNEVNIPDDAWELLGKRVTPYFTSIVPALHPLSGAIERSGAASSQPIKRQKLDNETTGKAQLPQHFTNYRNEFKEATPEEIERVFNKIRELYHNDPFPIDYFELVVNPKSFGHTVENIFHLSFLVKDGLVKIFLNENGLPVVEPVEINVDTENTEQDTTGTSYQVIISLSYDEWKQIVDAYELRGKPPTIEPPSAR